ncbi:hypothetical protein EYF80_028910 [Liparis tanakae]|uniref:Uncharacterized protein n=1 Tax=Liparis tanakae TaxID=230148 RepID=A0A4Z2H6P1_9TELE|nr:hypothetical protein EYF80_028910 [Liparis tanakae]
MTTHNRRKGRDLTSIGPITAFFEPTRNSGSWNLSLSTTAWTLHGPHSRADISPRKLAWNRKSSTPEPAEGEESQEGEGELQGVVGPLTEPVAGQGEGGLHQHQAGLEVGPDGVLRHAGQPARRRGGQDGVSGGAARRGARPVGGRGGGHSHAAGGAPRRRSPACTPEDSERDCKSVCGGRGAASPGSRLAVTLISAVSPLSVWALAWDPASSRMATVVRKFCRERRLEKGFGDGAAGKRGVTFSAACISAVVPFFCRPFTLTPFLISSRRMSSCPPAAASMLRDMPLTSCRHTQLQRKKLLP